jgi:hypothetical protein
MHGVQSAIWCMIMSTLLIELPKSHYYFTLKLFLIH